MRIADRLLLHYSLVAPVYSKFSDTGFISKNGPFSIFDKFKGRRLRFLLLSEFDVEHVVNVVPYPYKLLIFIALEIGNSKKNIFNFHISNPQKGVKKQANQLKSL